MPLDKRSSFLQQSAQSLKTQGEDFATAARGMAADLKRKKIAVVTLMPGFMRTERVVRMLTTDSLKKQFGFAKSESTEYLGRAVAALASDPDAAKKSGRIHFVADLAMEYGFTDVDGRQVPRFFP